MDPAELTATVEATRRFATEVVAEMVGTEGRDGSLDRLDAVLAQATELGIMASALPDAAGHDYGVWGVDCRDNGPVPSLLLLEQLAKACAGTASCVHHAGLGAHLLHGSPAPVGRAALALAYGQWLARGDAETELPSEPSPQLTEQDGTWSLDGRCGFVHAPPDTEAFIVYATHGERSRAVVVPAAAAGLTCRDVGPRTGLAACQVLELGFRGVTVDPTQLAAETPAEETISLLWLGLGAIAVGNAQGALEAARRYASERYQGGRMIAGHGAVRLLLGGAEARIATCRAGLMHVAASQPVSRRTAAMLKVQCTAECAQAVSDCLQVLGGSGYLEDYRLEKRLRDALTLKSMAGRSNDLLSDIARIALEDPS
ncbi:MAG: acyl-CoA/acyl-ACP dehydrogenase [Deltaproteobacteria bacterium]|nr:acyl-CoA/acyl-ACP dehydrogenase [Deltaproteobacteria bacterium]